jgi:hypothetical protein
VVDEEITISIQQKLVGRDQDSIVTLLCKRLDESREGNELFLFQTVSHQSFVGIYPQGFVSVLCEVSHMGLLFIEQERDEQAVLFIVTVESVAAGRQEHTVAGVQETNIIFGVPFDPVTGKIFRPVVIAADALIGRDP